jgi:hypothetical protein
MRVTIMCPLTDEACVKGGACKIGYCVEEKDTIIKAEDLELRRLVKHRPEGWAQRVLEILGLI